MPDNVDFIQEQQAELLSVTLPQRVMWGCLSR